MSAYQWFHLLFISNVIMAVFIANNSYYRLMLTCYTSCYRSFMCFLSCLWLSSYLIQAVKLTLLGQKIQMINQSADSTLA